MIRIPISAPGRLSSIRASLPLGMAIVCLCSCLCLLGCGLGKAPVADGPALPISLVERWSEVRVDAAVTGAESAPSSVIRFGGEGGIVSSFEAVSGIEGLRVEGGLLVGRTSGATPVLLLEVTEPLGAGDELWAAEITVRASAGTRTGVHPVRQPGPPIPAIVARSAEWPFSSPLVAGPLDAEGGPEPHRVEADDVFLLEMPPGLTDIRQILVQPTNVPDADFEIESVRLIFRKEYLASIESGPGWHGLGEIFRETLVARAPETLSFTVTLPERPWLHLAVGSVAADPPSFEISVAEPGEEGEPTRVAELEVEGPEVWLPTRLDLGAWAGREVEIRLSARASASEAGAEDGLAFWGAPTIRSASSSTAPDSESDSEEPPRLVVLFLCDTLRSDHLEAWGYERATAPNLARLASEGVLFRDAIAQATWTKASVSSILTSLHPATTGVAGLNDRVSAGETTLAEVFRKAGYATFATSSVPFTGQLTNLHQGVEVLHEFGSVKANAAGYQSKTASHWVSTFLDWVELHGDVPAFAFVHVMDPHSPFRPPEPYDTLFGDAEGAARFEEQAAKVEPLIESPLLRRFMAPSRQELEAAGVDAESFVAQEKAWYDGSIRGVDDNVGRLMEKLGELDLRDRALFAFVSDHGEAFLEHDLHWHGNSVYGELTNVPMLLWGQVLGSRGMATGQAIEATVQTLDLMPTLVELAGLSVPERAQGKSLVPLLQGADSGRIVPAFSEQRRPPEGGRPPHDSFAMVKGEWKLIWHVNPPDGVATHELYHHATDPLDLRDVTADHPEVVAEMASEIERWLKWAEAAKLDDAAVQSAMSAEELEQLRSLGYVE